MSLVREVVRELNGGIHDHLEAGKIIPVHFEGRPDFRLISDNPFSIESYGFLTRRGPRLVGTFALEGFVGKISEEKLYPYAIIRAASDHYGVISGTDLLNHAARAVGLGPIWTPIDN